MKADWFTKAVGVVISGFTLEDRKISRDKVTGPAPKLALAELGADTPSEVYSGFLNIRRCCSAHTATGLSPDLIPSLLVVTNLFFSICTSHWEGAELFFPWLSQDNSSCSPSLNLGPFFPHSVQLRQ